MTIGNGKYKYGYLDSATTVFTIAVAVANRSISRLVTLFCTESHHKKVNQG
jgi:hypothetical protein